MNILFIAKSTDIEDGGVEVATQNLATLFNAKGNVVFSANYSRNKCTHPYIDNLLIDQTSVDEAGGKLIEYIEKHKIDVIINQIYHHLYNTQLIIHIYQNVNVPIVSCLHTTPLYLNDVKTHWFLTENICSPKTFIKWSLRIVLYPYYIYVKLRKYENCMWTDYLNSDAYAVLSEAYKDNFKTVFENADAGKICVFRNAISDRMFSTEKLDKKQNTIIFVGRLSKEKRIDMILNVWKKISYELPTWDLKIIGDGPTKKQLAVIIKNQNIERVKLCGHTSEPQQYYNSAKILLLTSRYEGLPMVIVEASVRGVVPVVMNSFAAANDIIQNNITGIVTENNNVDQMAQKIIDLASNPDLLESMSINAQQQMRQNYSQNAIYEQWQNIFKAIKK